ncbi:MAG: EF-hand domain-containing protein [Paracoccaceae bacterium]
MKRTTGAALAAVLVALAATAQAAERKGLEGYDLNGDGDIAMSELLNIRTYNFNLVDGDADGRITRDDILAAVKARKLPRSVRRDEGFMMTSDLNGDGVLTLAEFTDFSALFRIVDQNGDGVLQADELAANPGALKQAGLI